MEIRRKYLDLCRRWRLWMGLPAGLAVALLPIVIAHAGDKDHEQALSAFKSGEIVSLREMLLTVEQQFIGQVIEVELERDDESDGHLWKYEIKILSPDGNIANIEFDAKSKKVLRTEGRAVERTSRSQ